MVKDVYPYEELHSDNTQRIFKSDAKEAAFLLGGIGTGNISIGPRGELKHWEIFNRPAKDAYMNDTFFAIYAKEDKKDPIAKVLESRFHQPYSGGFGFGGGAVAGLPRLEDSTMRGEYPFVWIDFKDDELPVKVSLEAFTPFIPLNPEDSGIPCAIFKYKVKNIASNVVDVTIAGSFQNPVGICGFRGYGWEHGHNFAGNINEIKSDNGFSGLYMYSTNYKENYIRYGSLSIMTPEKNVTHKAYWMEGGWWDGVQDFWDDFRSDGLLEPASSTNAVGSELVPNGKKAKVGSIGIPVHLGPGQEKVFTFVFSWYFPNRVKAWDYYKEINEETPITRNHYAKLYKDAWDVGRYVLENLNRLESESRKFHSAFFGSTLPGYVLDAAASNITVLRSPTCFWLEDGTFAGWEGCGDKNGCCHGTCTHVWNYAQTVAFLFPTLEQNARKTEFNYETDEAGKMSFRANSVFGLPRWDFHPATDGQMGAIIRLCREWKLSGDMEFLRSVWEGAKRALDFAFTYWDSDGDFVLDSQQHNTYDIEFYGPNSLTNSMFFGALKAGVEFAKAMGDTETAEKYQKALDKGSKKMDEMLWNGEYYIQKIEDVNKYKYQYGTGCLSDQVLGQMLAHVANLGYVLPEEHVKKAVESIFKYNFITSFYKHHNVQRNYAMNDEKGLLLCSWPNGGRPKLPFVYSDEVWPGIEYQVAAHLIYEGLVDEGLAIVKAIRDRHDGYRRNPWNEVECGHHYTRSMASWAVPVALTGFKCDMVKKEIHFSPKINADDFTGFWSTGTAWGVYRQKIDAATGKLDYSVDVLYGNLDGVKIIVDREENK